MSDEQDKKENESLPSEQNTHIVRLQAIKAVKELSNENSNWLLTQEILQEIQAGHIVANPEKRVPVTNLVTELKAEIEARYKDNDEVRKLLLDSVPHDRSVREWLKKDGWDEAVWKKIRTDGLFSQQNRAKVIKALMDRALDKSDVAAKIYLTLSGDYSEKMEVNDKSVDQFREINSILHRKKRDDQ